MSMNRNKNIRDSLLERTIPYELELTASGSHGGRMTLLLKEEIGRGGSCIAYLAEVSDGPLAGNSKIVKEYYPEGLGIGRAADGSLEVADGAREEFGLRRERFSQGIEWFGRAYELESPLTLPRPDFVGEANGTLYSVSDPWEGATLSACDDEDLHDVACEALEVCAAMRALHSEGLLYLDCKPSNLYRYRDLQGRPHVALFDFDTVTRISDLEGDDPPVCSSWSHGWAPWEQRDRGAWRLMGPATDVYSVGATFLWMVAGLSATPDVSAAATGDFGLDWWGESRDGVRRWLEANAYVSGETVELIDEIARGALAERPGDRISLPELEGLLGEIRSNSYRDESLANRVEGAARKAVGVVEGEGKKTREASAAATAQAASQLEQAIAESSARRFFTSKKVIAIAVAVLLVIAVVAGILIKIGSSAVDVVTGSSAQIDSTVDEHLLLQLDNANHQYEMGLENWRRLDYNKADSDIKTARDEISEQVSQSEVEVAKVNNSLGSLYLDMGKYEEAYDYLNAAYVTFRDAYGDFSLEARATKFNIAEYDYYIGDFDSALKELQTIENLSESQSEKAILTSVETLKAMIFDARGDYSGAIAQYEGALRLYSDLVQDGKVVSALDNYANDSSLTQDEKEQYTEDFVCVARIYSNLAEVYIHQVNYDQAASAAQTGLSICLDNVYIGKKNLATSELYKNLALAESMKGEFSQAVDDVDLAMRIQLNLFDFEGVYPGLVEVYDTYGSILQSSGKSAEALNYYEQALSLSVDSFGENHPQTAQACRTIGEFKSSEEDFDEAITYFERGIEIRKNVLGEKHPDTALLYVDLAEAQLASGDADIAAENATLALSICDSLDLNGGIRSRAESIVNQSKNR
jgi:tetratricopeptide (TPR) repeat protein